MAGEFEGKVDSTEMDFARRRIATQKMSWGRGKGEQNFR